MSTTETEEALPQLPHIAGDFYLWLWWASESNDSLFSLGDPVGEVELWVDERITFRNPEETKVTAVLTGDNPSATLEARAALAGGKVLSEIRLGLRRDDREFHCSLKGPGMDLRGVKLPQVLQETQDEALYDRMFLYEELCLVLQGLLKHWGAIRRSEAWNDEIVPEMRRWVLGQG